MSQRRTVILLVAIVVGAFAAFLLFNYVRGIEDRAQGDAQRVEAFQARAPIERGTEGNIAVEERLVAEVRIPNDVRPTTAIRSLDEIQMKVALFDIAENTVIVDGMFVDRSQAQVGFRQRLRNPELTAITIDVAGYRGVGGLLVAGDDVNIMVFQDFEDDDVPEGEVPPETTGLMERGARYLYQDVRIIAVGESVLLDPGETVEEGTTPVQSSLITLAVPPDAARWIASFDSNFYLALTPEEYEPRPVAPLTPDVQELPGESEGLLTPYCGPEIRDPELCEQLGGEA